MITGTKQHPHTYQHQQAPSPATQPAPPLLLVETTQAPPHAPPVASVATTHPPREASPREGGALRCAWLLSHQTRPHLGFLPLRGCFLPVCGHVCWNGAPQSVWMMMMMMHESKWMMLSNQRMLQHARRVLGRVGGWGWHHTAGTQGPPLGGGPVYTPVCGGVKNVVIRGMWGYVYVCIPCTDTHLLHTNQHIFTHTKHPPQKTQNQPRCIQRHTTTPA